MKNLLALFFPFLFISCGEDIGVCLYLDQNSQTQICEESHTIDSCKSIDENAKFVEKSSCIEVDDHNLSKRIMIKESPPFEDKNDTSANAICVGVQQLYFDYELNQSVYGNICSNFLNKVDCEKKSYQYLEEQTCENIGINIPVDLKTGTKITKIFTDNLEFAQRANNYKKALKPDFIAGGTCVHDLSINDGLKGFLCTEFVTQERCAKDNANDYTHNMTCKGLGFIYSKYLSSPASDKLLLFYSDKNSTFDQF